MGQLVLSRRRWEAVTIGVPGWPPIHVTAVKIGRDKVQLGFEADPAIVIHRDEVWDLIHAEEAHSCPE